MPPYTQKRVAKLTSKTRIHPEHPNLSRSAERAMSRIDRLGYLLDNSIRIPGIGYRIGYDALIGLIPGVGDLVGLGLSSYIIVEAARVGTPPSTLLRMVVNVAIESIFGAIPFLGDVFDATWKANARNLKLLHSHVNPHRAGRVASNRRYFTTLAVSLVLLLLLTAVLAYLLVRALLDLAGII